MAPKAIAVLLAAAIMAASWSAASAQSGCTSVLISLLPCLSFIQGSASTPSSSCCSQLANVVQSQPRCLCQVLSGNGAAFGVTINQTQALALPGACNVQTPNPSLCNAAAGGPAPSPAAVPPPPPAPSTPSTPSPPSAPTTPAPPINPTIPAPPIPQIPLTPATPATPSVPSTGGQSSSSGSSNGMAVCVFFALLSVASYASPAGFF